MKPKILLSCKNKSETYAYAVNINGGEAVAEYLPVYSDEYDGLLLCGGSDIEPSLYGEQINGSVNIDNDRDAAEWELLRRFLEAGKPVFGICRGCQIINAYFGGTLCQDIRSSVTHTSSDTAVSCHEITSTGGKIRRLYGENFVTNSYHHQAVKDIAADFTVTAFCKADGVIEAIEHKSLPVFAVQWHPERMLEPADGVSDGNLVLKDFISMCGGKDNDK